MNEVDTAMLTKLSAGAGLTVLLASSSAIYSWQAPDNAAYPFVVFNDMSDTEANDTQHEIHNMVYQVRGYSNVSMKKAKAIDYQIRALLHEQTLNISGFVQLRCVREGSVRFVENQPNTQTVYSAGGLYRLIVERTA